MQKTCTITGKEFEITDDDLKFYEKIGVPPPTLCPEERQQRRLAWRNERKLYHRKSDATGKTIISIYSPESKVKAYEPEYWWSDKWNAKDYGQYFDSTKSFFEQFQNLFLQVPKMSLLVDGNENSYYVNQSGWDKNCYLCFSADHNEDSFYSQDTYYSKDICDSLLTYRSELCYESLYSRNCYNCRYIQNCKNCSNSWFLKNCIGCTDCFGCVNLRNKQYHFNNIQYTKERYFKKLEALSLGNYSFITLAQKGFFDFTKTLPHKFAEGEGNENVIGNYVSNSHNARECYESSNLENCSFCENIRGAKDCIDVNRWGQFAELCYDSNSIGEGVYNVLFCDKCWGAASNLTYCIECIGCVDCFGCVGLRNAQYCILNKQYTKEEYFILRDKIIEHMKQTGEWGEFFPIEASPFAYNETVAQEYFPLTKEEVLQKGYQWKDDEPSAKYTGPKVEIPDTIQETSDDICNQILECEECSKNYRIVKPELQFYRKMDLPVPHKCPDCRHKAHMALRNPRQLWTRNCDNCEKEIETTFAPERPEKVFCEECYLKVVQ